MPARSASVPLLALVFAAALPAQATWVVDRLVRPGTHFVDLPAAVAAAAPGDVIVVRYTDPLVAPYTAPTIGRALTIVAQGGRPGLLGDLRIENVPAGEHVAVRDLQLAPFAGANPALSNCHFRIRSCTGTVHLQNLSRGSLPQTTSAANLWLVEQCRLVEFESCAFEMAGANGTMRIANSASVVATGSAFQHSVPSNVPLLAVTNSNLRLGNTVVMSTSVAAGALAIDACNSTIALAGIGTTVVRTAGGTAIGSTCGGTVIVGSGANVGAVAGLQLVAQPVAALGGGISTTQMLQITMFGESLGIGVIAVGQPLAAPVPLFGGGLWLDPFAAGTLALLPFDLSGRGVWQVPLTTPLPTGDTAWLQGVTLGLQSGFLLTPPAVVIGP